MNAETGESFWRVVSADNVESIFGRTAQARIADPTDSGRVFRWLLEQRRDSTGNVIQYDYKSEDAAGVDSTAIHEQNRLEAKSGFANRYPKRIRYGNRTPDASYYDRFEGRDGPDRTETGPDGWLLDEPDDWLFEVVFDYGEHADSSPASEAQDTSQWDVRSDPFSTHRAGFEVRTWRLCRRVLVFHHVDAGGESNTRLVRSTDFIYREDPKLTHLERVTQTGYAGDPASDGGYRTESLPPVDLGYTGDGIVETSSSGNGDNAEDTTVSGVSLESDAGAIDVLDAIDGDQYRWVDLDGEGISGLLARSDGDWLYRRNLGDGELAPYRQVERLPSGTDLGRSHQLVDLTGDGQIDLVEFGGATAGFHERDDDRGWSGFRPFESNPNVDWNEPNLRQVDVTGDGRADLLISEQRVFTLYESRGEEGFDASSEVVKALHEAAGPAVVFDDGTESIHLADMSGDGLSDIVRIRNGEVCYWPSLGYGRFGRKVTMGSAPRFAPTDAFEPLRLRLGDIDGTGMTDLIYLDGDGARYWFNESGNAWSDPEAVPGFPPVDNLASVQVTDLLGHGTSCLVWSSGLSDSQTGRMKYIDLMGGTKPHLLQTIDNNRGRRTTIHYASSTKYYLEDRRAGRPWATRLPFPVQVVERVVTEEKVTNTRQVERYAYHHGYFDGHEREFRGFGMVETWDADLFETFRTDDADDEAHEGLLEQPPAHTKTWYHTGAYRDGEEIGRAYRDEYYAGDPDAAELPDTQLSDDWSASEQREAARALRGKMLRREVYADDGKEAADRPYRVEERSYRLRRLAEHGEDRHALFHTYQGQSLTHHYEREPEDPRVQHQLTLTVDPYGNPTRTVQIGYPRRREEQPAVFGKAAAQNERKVLLTETDYINKPDLVSQGYYRVGVPAERREYEVTGLPEPANESYELNELTPLFQGQPEDDSDEMAVEPRPFEAGPSPERDASEPPVKRLLSRREIEYWTDDLRAAHDDGNVGGLALPRQTYELALTDGLIRQVYKSDEEVEKFLQEFETGYEQRPDENPEEWWARSGIRHYDDSGGGFFRMIEFVDPFGGSHEQTYDDFALFPETLRKPKFEVEGGAVDRLETTIDHDYRAMRPRRVTDPNGNADAVRFDPLGMVEARAAMGADSEGDSLEDFVGGVPPEISADPADAEAFLDELVARSTDLLQGATERMFIDLDRFADGGRPACVLTIRRRTHASELSDEATPEVERAITFLDGLGREVMSKKEVAPGPAPARNADGDLIEDDSGELVTEKAEPRWVGTGRTVFDNKGRPVKKYEPFFASTANFDEEEELVEHGVTPVMHYDPLGRLVRKYFPDGTMERVEFDAWQKTAWDRNDSVLESEWYGRRSTPPGVDQPHEVTVVEGHADTPTHTHFDPLGRSYRTVGDDGDHEIPTTKHLSLEGKALAVKDAKGRDVMTFRYDMLGRRMATVSMDAGTKRSLQAADGKPLRRWDDRDQTIATSYDALRRPTDIEVTPSDGDAFFAEKTVYGVEAPGAKAANLLGKPYRQYDGAGRVTHEAFDFRDNLVEKRRTLTASYEETPDWGGRPDLEGVSFVDWRAYDAAGRVTERKIWHVPNPTGTTDASHLTDTDKDNPVAHEVRTYTKTGRIRSIEADPRETGSTTYLREVDHNARGQRKRIDYGAVVDPDTDEESYRLRTTHTYDPETFRLDKLETERKRDGKKLQNRTYQYDPVGNITRVLDHVADRTFTENNVAEPGAKYGYDALYRLTFAKGRERTAMGTSPPGGNTRKYQSIPGESWTTRGYERTYKYDDVGNFCRVIHDAKTPHGDGWTRRYLYENDNNQLRSTEVSGSLKSYDYDDHGNMTKMPHLNGLSWNHRDELRSVTKSEDQTAHFQYDAEGQRVRKVEKKAGTVEERIYLGGFEIYRRRRGEMAERRGRLERRRETLHIGDDNGRIALVETKTHDDGDAVDNPQPLTRYQLTDHLESSVKEVDGDRTEVVNYEEYYPYGETAYKWAESETEAKRKRYRYTGKERDSLAGFYYYGARYYAPWLGRWTAPDPAGLVDGVNLYVYTRANPARFRDPQGLDRSDETNVKKGKQSKPGAGFVPYSGGGDSDETKDTTKQKTIKELKQMYWKLVGMGRLAGAKVAADNLSRFLKGTGGTKKVSPAWLRQFEPVERREKSDERKIDIIFQGAIMPMLRSMKKGGSGTLEESWVGGIDADRTEQPELYFASGKSSLKTTVNFEFRRVDEGEGVVSVRVRYEWMDTYDWHKDLSVEVPTVGVIRDEQAVRLQKNTEADEFELRSYYERSFEREVDIGPVPEHVEAYEEKGGY